MRPLRREEIALLCEDGDDGRSQRLIEAALQELKKDFHFALAVEPIGIRSKNDVKVRTKFARDDGFRAFGLRDRDFLQRAQLNSYQNVAFHTKAENVEPWPLPRHCIESYLLDDDVLGAGIPTIEIAIIRAVLEKVPPAWRATDV